MMHEKHWKQIRREQQLVDPSYNLWYANRGHSFQCLCAVASTKVVVVAVVVAKAAIEMREHSNERHPPKKQKKKQKKKQNSEAGIVVVAADAIALISVDLFHVLVESIRTL